MIAHDNHNRYDCNVNQNNDLSSSLDEEYDDNLNYSLIKNQIENLNNQRISNYEEPQSSDTPFSNVNADSLGQQEQSLHLPAHYSHHKTKLTEVKNSQSNDSSDNVENLVNYKKVKQFQKVGSISLTNTHYQSQNTTQSSRKKGSLVNQVSSSHSQQQVLISPQPQSAQHLKQSCIFCQKFNAQYSFCILLNKALYSKFSSSQNYFYSKDINEILNGNHSNLTIIRFRDMELFDDDEEFLKRFYFSSQIPVKLADLTEYYKYHKDIPRLFMQSIAFTMNRYHDKRRRIEYQRIKKQLDLDTSNNNNTEQSKSQSNTETDEEDQDEDEEQQQQDSHGNKIKKKTEIPQECLNMLDNLNITLNYHTRIATSHKFKQKPLLLHNSTSPYTGTNAFYINHHPNKLFVDQQSHLTHQDKLFNMSSMIKKPSHQNFFPLTNTPSNETNISNNHMFQKYYQYPPTSSEKTYQLSCLLQSYHKNTEDKYFYSTEMSMSNFNSILRPTTQPNHDISNILTNTKPNPRVIPSNSMNNLNFFKKTLPHSEFSNNLVISSLLQNHLNDIPQQNVPNQSPSHAPSLSSSSLSLQLLNMPLNNPHHPQQNTTNNNLNQNFLSKPCEPIQNGDKQRETSAKSLKKVVYKKQEQVQSMSPASFEVSKEMSAYRINLNHQQAQILKQLKIVDPSQTRQNSIQSVAQKILQKRTSDVIHSSVSINPVISSSLQLSSIIKNSSLTQVTSPHRPPPPLSLHSKNEKKLQQTNRKQEMTERQRMFSERKDLFDKFSTSNNTFSQIQKDKSSIPKQILSQISDRQGPKEQLITSGTQKVQQIIEKQQQQYSTTKPLNVNIFKGLNNNRQTSSLHQESLLLPSQSEQHTLSNPPHASFSSQQIYNALHPSSSQQQQQKHVVAQFMCPSQPIGDLSASLQFPSSSFTNNHSLLHLHKGCSSSLSGGDARSLLSTKEVKNSVKTREVIVNMLNNNQQFTQLRLSKQINGGKSCNSSQNKIKHTQSPSMQLSNINIESTVQPTSSAPLIINNIKYLNSKHHHSSMNNDLIQKQFYKTSAKTNAITTGRPNGLDDYTTLKNRSSSNPKQPKGFSQPPTHQKTKISLNINMKKCQENSKNMIEESPHKRINGCISSSQQEQVYSRTRSQEILSNQMSGTITGSKTSRNYNECVKNTSINYKSSLKNERTSKNNNIIEEKTIVRNKNCRQFQEQYAVASRPESMHSNSSIHQQLELKSKIKSAKTPQHTNKLKNSSIPNSPVSLRKNIIHNMTTSTNSRKKQEGFTTTRMSPMINIFDQPSSHSVSNSYHQNNSVTYAYNNQQNSQNILSNNVSSNNALLNQFNLKMTNRVTMNLSNVDSLHHEAEKVLNNQQATKNGSQMQQLQITKNLNQSENVVNRLGSSESSSNVLPFSYQIQPHISNVLSQSQQQCRRYPYPTVHSTIISNNNNNNNDNNKNGESRGGSSKICGTKVSSLIKHRQNK